MNILISKQIYKSGRQVQTLDKGGRGLFCGGAAPGKIRENTHLPCSRKQQEPIRIQTI